MVLEELCSYLEECCAPYAPVGIDRLAPEGEAIGVLSLDKSLALEGYMDGAVRVRARVALKARGGRARQVCAWVTALAEHFLGGREVVMANGEPCRVTLWGQPRLEERPEAGGALYGLELALDYIVRPFPGQGPVPYDFPTTVL